MEDTLVKDEEERVAARNAKILKIPLLWAVAQGWLGGDEQKINARSIVNGFLNFHDYLTDHGKSEYAVVVNDLFAGVPKGEIFAEDLTWTADQLLDSLTSWTEQVRDHINAEELMKMLREHLVEWFDTDPSLQGQERKRYRELFQEIDFYSEGNLNIDLVMRLVGAFSDSAALPEEAKEHYIHALPHWLPSSLTNVQDDADDSASLANFGDQLAAAAPAAEGEAAAPAASEGGDEIAPAAAAAPAESEEAPAAAAADAEGGDEAAAAPDNEGGAAAPAAADAEGGAAPAAADAVAPASEGGEEQNAEEASTEAAADAEAAALQAETEARESIHSEFPDDVPVRIKSGKRRQSVYVAQEGKIVSSSLSGWLDVVPPSFPFSFPFLFLLPSFRTAKRHVYAQHQIYTQHTKTYIYVCVFVCVCVWLHPLASIWTLSFALLPCKNYSCCVFVLCISGRDRAMVVG